MKARRRLVRRAEEMWTYARALAAARLPEAQFAVLSLPRLPTQILYDKRAHERFDVSLRRGTTDWRTFQQIFVDRDYDLSRLARHAEIMAAFDAIVARGSAPLIVDCGANIGLSALWFARSFPAARVVAVEPEPANFALARRNCARANATVLNAAVASADSQVALVDPGLGSDAFRTRAAAPGEPALAARSVPSLVAGAQAGAAVAPFLIKIDIEGFESELFSQDTDWIDDFPVLIIELHDWMLPGTASSANALRALAGRNRDFVHLGENVFSLRN
jgi:FkbM family methyltransferase